MTLNLIDKKMVVKNTVSLFPEKTYTYASALCRDFSSLEIEKEGTYGQLDAKSLKIQHSEPFRPLVKGSSKNVNFEKIYFLNNNFNYNDISPPLEVLNKLKVFAESNDWQSNTTLADYNKILQNVGLTPDYSKNYKFGIEKVKQKYLIEDKNYFKKKSIKNLCRYYKENMKHRSLNPAWGFDNYNCLNFFSIKNNRSEGLTHRNCMAYPNERQGTQNAYSFYGNNNTMTLSFYINQNKKNETGYHFNPGCIVYIPGIIGLYAVKGSNVDKNNLTESFRLYASLDDTVNGDFLNANITSGDRQVSDSHFLTTDNILKFNNWHNVTISLKHKSQANRVSIDFYVDGQVIDSVELAVSNTYNDLQTNSFVSIGNNPMKSDNTISEMFKLLFSVNKSQADDFVGPYANKHISFLNDFIESGVSNETFDLNRSLNVTASEYFTNETTSLALNAELHDIRIYNKIIRDVKNVICNNNITDFSDQSLVFSVPVLYYDVDILKKSVVNLFGTTNNDENTPTLNDVDLAHLILSGPVNHVFSNKCLGHEVNIEKFTYEFKNKVSPNIILNNDISSDQTTFNILNAIKCDDDDINSNTQELIKKGHSVNDIVRTIILNENNKDHLSDFYYKNSFEYKNNFILPCDNGLQNQKRYGFVNYYETNNKPLGHFVDTEYFDISHISLEDFINDDLILDSTHLKFESSDPGLYQYAYDLKSLKTLEEREDFYVDNNIRFKNNYDFFKNVSLYNFLRTDFSLNNSDNEFIIKTSVKEGGSLTTTNIEVGPENLMKDLSNPACRKIDDDYANSIASYLARINFKNLSLDGSNFIPYYRTELPIYNTTDNKGENFTKSFCFSNQLIGKKLEKDSIVMFDSDMAGTFGTLKMTLKDNGKGKLYRSDAKTKIADWNGVGHVLYNEGIINILHPSLENFAEIDYKINYTGNTNLNVLELNLPAYHGKTNKTRNNSAIENLRLNESAFNSDEDFVYITDINLHDENLNIVAKAKIVKPYAKKDSDGALFRLKMDY